MSAENNRFKLWYFDRDNYEREVLIAVEVLVPKETMTVMLTGRAKFLRFIINDGETFVISSEWVHSIKQIF